MGLGLTFYAGQALTGSDLVALVNAARNSTASINAAATTAGSDTTTSATYVNMAGTGSLTSFSWTKYRDDTDVRLMMAASWFATVNSAVLTFGLRLNGTDYDIVQSSLALNGAGMPSGFREISGIPAGTYTLQCRWKRASGAGTGNRSTTEWLAASATELN